MSSSPPHRPKVITVLNLKGGVGKTHTVWLFTAVCQERGLRLLAIDTDTQANLSHSLFPEPDGKPGVEALFNPDAAPDPRSLVRRTRFEHVDVIPAGPELAAFDLSRKEDWERYALHTLLEQAVEQLRGDYDYIILDCPPRLSLVSFASLCCSDHVLIPLESADWGAQGVVRLTAAIKQIRELHNPRLTLLGYLVSRFHRARSYQQSYLAQLRAKFGPLAFDVVVPDLALYERAVIDNVPVTIHAPHSEEAGIARKLFDEIEGRIRKTERARRSAGRADVRRIPSAVAEPV